MGKCQAVMKRKEIWRSKGDKGNTSKKCMVKEGNKGQIKREFRGGESWWIEIVNENHMYCNLSETLKWKESVEYQ
jgi:hypothetical protein